MSSKHTPPQAWFRNPTEEKALESVAREERRSAMLKTKLTKVYIASPYRGDTERNVRNAIRYCRFAMERGKFPIAPHIWLPRFLDDDNPAERAAALEFGKWLLTQCSEVWVFGGTISDGMKGEIETAERHRKPVRFFTGGMEEVHR